MDTSNIGQIVRWLDDFVDSFDFLRVGEDQSLGRDIMKEVVEGIQKRSGDEKRGAGAEWDLNEPKYAAWKVKRYKLGPEEPNVRTGQMLSQKSLEGRTKIEAKEIMMIYGVGDPPDKTRTLVPLPTYTRGDHVGEQIDDKTDIEKAYFAHTGQGQRGVIRPFYEVDETIAAGVIEDCPGKP